MSDATEPKHEHKADASERRVARVYAEALLDEALKRDAGPEVLDEMQALLAQVTGPGSDPLMQSFFLAWRRRPGGARRRPAPRLRGPGQRRAAQLRPRPQRARPARTPSARRGRLPDLLEQRTGKVRVQVRSAVPLEDDQRARLTEQLHALLQREPVLEETVDPALLGGLVVQVGDYLFDASVRNRLRSIKDQLIERSSHAIQTGRDRFSSAV